MEKTTIDGVDYIEIECMATRYNAQKEEAKAEKYECIEVGVKDVNVKEGYIIYRLLIPVKNLIAYNSDKMKELEDNSLFGGLRRFLTF